MNCVCKRQWFYKPNLVIHIINLNNKKYDIECLNSLMVLSICKEEVDNLDIQYIINHLINNGDIKLGNVPRWWESKADIFVDII